MALSFTRNTQDISYVNSPQFVTATEDDTTNTHFILELFVWSGGKTSPPSTPQQTFQVNSFVDTNQLNSRSADFEISEAIQVYLEDFVPSSTSTAIQYNMGSAVWYRFQITSNITTTPLVSTTKLAVRGYGEYTESVNPGTTVADQNEKPFGGFPTFQFLSNTGQYFIPVYVGDNSTNFEISGTFLDGTSFGGEFLTDFSMQVNSPSSNFQIAYIPFGILGYGDLAQANKLFVAEEQIQFKVLTLTSVAANVDQYKLDVVCTKEIGHNLLFLGKEGMYKYVPLLGRVSSSISVERQEFQNRSLNLQSSTPFDTTRHVQRIYNIFTNESAAVNTGNISQATQDILIELMSSTLVYLTTSTETVPVNLTNRSISLTNRKFDQITNYTINLQIARPYINNLS